MEAILGFPVVVLRAHILIVNCNKYVALDIIIRAIVSIIIIFDLPGLNLNYPWFSHFEVENCRPSCALIELEYLAHGQLDRLEDVTDEDIWLPKQATHRARSHSTAGNRQTS